MYVMSVVYHIVHLVKIAFDVTRSYEKVLTRKCEFPV